MVERILPFRDVNYTINANFESTFRSGALRELGLTFDGSYTSPAVTPAGKSYQCPANLIGPMELVQNGVPRIKAEFSQLYHISALYAGGYFHQAANLSITSGFFNLAAVLPLWKMMDGAGIDATGVECMWRGVWRSHTYYTQTAPATGIDSTTKLRPYGVSAEVVPAGGFLDPEWTNHSFDISSLSTALAYQLDIGAGVFLPGIMLEAMDASGGNGTDARTAVDGLIRKVTVEVNIPGESSVPIVKEATWGMLREETCRRAGFSNDDETTSTGMVWIPFVQRRNGQKRDALFLPPKSNITITFDNSSTVEGIYTSVAPAAGDTARVLLPRFLARQNQAIEAATTSLAAGRAQLGRRALRAGQAPGRVRQYAR